MELSSIMDASEVKELLGISQSKAYQIIRLLNNELSAKEFLIVAGKVSRQYFNERFYGVAKEEREDDNASL